jgi:preprotein translocase subunit SecE
MLGVRVPPALPGAGGTCGGWAVKGAFGRVTTFLSEVKAEVKKVVFPSRQETIGSTGVVIVFVLILGVFLSFVDTIWLHVVGVVIR